MKRFFESFLTFLLITILSFVVISLAPGDFLSQMALNPQISQDVLEGLREDFGLNRPVWVQYLLWLKNFLMGDWSYSLTYQCPVFSLILSRLGSTIVLMGVSLLLTWILVIPLALSSAMHRRGAIDRICSLCSLISIAMPVFFLAMCVVFMASQTASWPLSGTVRLDYEFLDPLQKMFDRLQHLFLPSLVLVFVSFGGYFRLMRSYVEEQLKAPYVLALHSRGISEFSILWRHVLKHSLNPMITLAGLQLPALLSGAAFVEIIFSWPGLGSLMLDAVMHQDLFVVMANLVLSAVLLLLGNALADWGLRKLDPRIG